jgi:hypothetical protein
VARPEPERELIRRLVPFSPIAAAVAFAAGALLSGPAVGWSALIGVVVVTLNFVAHGLSLAWAARISPTVLFAVGLGGFIVRLAVIAVVVVVLNGLSWFSVEAFAAAVVPATIVLLAAEMRAISGRLQADLWNFEGAPR